MSSQCPPSPRPPPMRARRAQVCPCRESSSSSSPRTPSTAATAAADSPISSALLPPATPPRSRSHSLRSNAGAFFPFPLVVARVAGAFSSVRATLMFLRWLMSLSPLPSSFLLFASRSTLSSKRVSRRQGRWFLRPGRQGFKRRKRV